MIDSHKIIMELTKQVSNENLTHCLLAEFTDLPYILALKAYDIYSTSAETDTSNLHDKPHLANGQHAFKIFYEMEEVIDPYWLEACPYYLHEFPSVINITPQDPSHMGLNTDIYLLHENHHKTKHHPHPNMD